jgi:hypothetical protein
MIVSGCNEGGYNRAAPVHNRRPKQGHAYTAERLPGGIRDYPRHYSEPREADLDRLFSRSRFENFGPGLELRPVQQKLEIAGWQSREAKGTGSPSQNGRRMGQRRFSRHVFRRPTSVDADFHRNSG